MGKTPAHVMYLQDILELIGPTALKSLRGKAPPDPQWLMEALQAASVLPPRLRGKLGEAILKAAQSRSGKKAISEAGSELLGYSRELLPSFLADAAWHSKEHGGRRYDIEDHERYQALEYLISLVAASPFFPPASQRKTTQLVEHINLHITANPEHYTELWELVDYFNRDKVKPLKLPKSHPVSRLFRELALTKQAAEFEIPPGVVGEAFRKARSRVDLFQIPQSVKHRRKMEKWREEQ